MKSLLITLTLLALWLHAGVQEVQTYYDAGEYEKAIGEAKASTHDYSNPTLHLLWAKSAEKLGRNNEAMSAYERVEILDENNIVARVALAKLYKRTGRDALARQSAKELQNYQLTPEQRNSLSLLRKVNLHSFKASATLSSGYDTNINVASNNLTGKASKIIGTAFAQFSGGVSYINELEDKGGWYSRGDIRLYDQKNFESKASLYNMLFASGGVGLGYGGAGYDFYIPVSYDTIHYLNKNLLSQVKVQPRLSYIFSNALIGSVDLSYISHTYTTAESLNKRDDTALALGGGLYYLLGNDYVYAKVKYENYSAKKKTTALYVNKSFFSTNIGVNYNISSWLVLKGDYRFRSASYKDDRKDSFHQLKARVSHYFADNYELYLSDSYAKNSSSKRNFEYSKNIVMLGVSLNY